MEIFRSMLHGLLPFFSGVLDWIVLILVWYGCTSYWTKLSLTIKTDDVTRSRRDMDLPSSYGQLNGEWVKQRHFSATHIN